MIGEQYIQLPRAICDLNSNPNKGQKSLTTKFYLTRYEDSLNLVCSSLPKQWIPTTVIIEGMFIIRTSPLHSHRTMAEYTLFLMRRYILPHFYKGTTEVHLLFDNPGCQQDNPKVFEQARRDAEALPAQHSCTAIYEEAEVPAKWQDTLKCRQCKRNVTVFISQFILQNIKPYLKEEQAFITAGALEDNSDSALAVSRTTTRPQANPLLASDAEESDYRIWLHVKHSSGNKKLILSPDRCVPYWPTSCVQRY